MTLQEIALCALNISVRTDETIIECIASPKGYAFGVTFH